MVSDSFGLCYLVPVHAGLPGPFPFANLLRAAVSEHLAVFEYRKTGFLPAVLRVPLYRSTHHLAVCYIHCSRLAGLFPGFAACPEIRPCKCPHIAVPGAVGEKRSLEPKLLTRPDILGSQ